MNKQSKLSKDGSLSRGIEWTDYTWNPVAGCLHNCRWLMPDNSYTQCYAETVAERVAQTAYPYGFEHHYWKPEQLTAPLSVKKPSRIFVGSMADVFGHWVPDEQIHAILAIVAQAPQHTFQFLTKNAPRLRQFAFPANCWLGVSVPPTMINRKLLTYAQRVEMLLVSLKHLRMLHGYAAKTWMSIEPLSWDISPYLDNPPLDWVVIGAATAGAKTFQPEAAWIEKTLAKLDAHNVPVFFKGNLEWTPWREDFPVEREAAR